LSAPKVVVVGGGVIGTACAYYLAKGGASVVLLERERLGAGASEGNAGCISPGHPPLNRPGRVAKALRQMLDPTSPLYVRPGWNPGLWRWLAGFARYCTDAHVETAMRVMAPLGKRSMVLFDELIREEKLECEYRADGYYEISSSEAGLEEARHDAGLLARHGYTPEIVDADELRRREPAVGPRALGGVRYPEGATLDPGLFLERLAGAARRLGVEVREGTEVRSVTVRSGRATGVRLARGGEEGCDAVVLATGPYSLQVARKVGVRLPVQPGKGYHRDIGIGPNGAPPLRIASVLTESSVFCTPLYGFVRFAGTMEFSGINRVMRPERLRQLTRSAREIFPSLGSARASSEWCGLRPMSVDGMPIIGPLGDVEGLSVATGHGMLGLTLSPVTAEIIARHVLHGGDPRTADLSPQRFR
jgi:D-amino-acid dehydrogenase